MLLYCLNAMSYEYTLVSRIKAPALISEYLKIGHLKKKTCQYKGACSVLGRKWTNLGENNVFLHKMTISRKLFYNKFHVGLVVFISTVL